MRDYLQTEQEQAYWEQGMLRDVLKPHLDDIADIRDGYKAMGSLLKVPKEDQSLVTSELSGHYRKIVEIMLSAYSLIHFTIARNYDSGDWNELPSFYINTKIFEEELYIPFNRLFVDGSVVWSEIEKKYDECWDRIQTACSNILGDDVVLAPHHELFSQATTVAQAALELPVCHGLAVDFKRGTVSYMGANPIEVGSQRNEMRLLKLLLQNSNRVVPYETIASKLDLNFYYAGMEPKEIAEKLRYLKNDLGKLLLDAGMPREVFSRMVSSKANVGYILTT